MAVGAKRIGVETKLHPDPGGDEAPPLILVTTELVTCWLPSEAIHTRVDGMHPPVRNGVRGEGERWPVAIRKRPSQPC